MMRQDAARFHRNNCFASDQIAAGRRGVKAHALMEGFIKLALQGNFSKSNLNN